MRDEGGIDLPFDPPSGPALTPEEILVRDMPGEVADWWKSLGVSGEFTIEVERVSQTTGATESMPPVHNRVPSKTEIGTHYGAGKYRFVLIYKPASWSKGTKRVPGPWFDLSEDGYGELHQQYRDRKDSQKRGKVLEAPNALSGLREIAPVLQTLVAAIKPVPQQNDNSMMVALIQSMSTQAQNQMTMMLESSKQTMQMMMGMMNNQSQMFQQMIQQGNKSNSEPSMDRFFGMMEKSMEIRDRLIQGPKEEPGMIEKLVSAAGELLPHIGQMLSAVKAVPAPFRGPMIQSAMASQPQVVRSGVELMQTDSGFRARVIEKAQAEYGDSAKEVLEALDIIAPAQEG